MLERQRAEALESRHSIGVTLQRCRLGCANQGAIERVSSDRARWRHRRFAAQHSVEEHGRIRDARRTQRAIKRDLPFGECSSLVSEQHLDVAEVLN